MKRVTVILAILFLAFGLAYAKDYTVTKKAGSYMVLISVILLRSCRMTHEERSRVAQLWRFNHIFAVFFLSESE